MSTPDEMGLTAEAARGYEAFFVPAIFHQWPEPICDAASISKADKVLDAGCGTGILTREVRRRGARVTGLDLSESMLGVAREVCPNVAFHKGNVCDLPFETDTFDVAVSAFMLMFVPQPEDAIREIIRVVRPGGRIAFSVWQNLDQNPVYRHLAAATKEVAGDDSAQAMAWPFTMGELQGLHDLAQAAGLDEVSVTPRDGTARFPSVEELVDVEVNAWLLADSVSQQQIDQICRLLRQYYGPFTDADGPVCFPLNGIIVSGTVSLEHGG